MEINNMHESITENTYYERGYQKGYSDAMEALGKKFDKIQKESLEKALEDCKKQIHKFKNESSKK